MAANEAKIVITAADQASKKLDGITEKARGMRTAFLAIGAATTAIGVVSVKAASDLEESAQAAEVTFKSAFEAVDQFANGAAGAFNLSRRAAFEYTAQLGGIFNASGLAAQASANMSIEATKLAADLASFKNLEIDVALQKIRAGLVGEVEPLRTVGVLLSAAAVEAKAMTLGLQDANGELSEGAKVQARFALITEQLSDAQGDVARTSESVANRTREMQKNMEDLRAEIGEQLLPVTSELLGKMNSLVTTMSETPDVAKTTAVSIGGVALAITTLGLVASPFEKGWGTILKTFRGLRAVIPVVGTAIASLGAGTLFTGGLLTAFGAAIGVVRVGMKDLESDVAEANKALHGFDGELKTISEQQKYDDILEQIISVEDAFGRFGNSFKDIAAQHAEAFNEIATVSQKTAKTIDLAMTGNIAMFEKVKKADVELARFKNDNGRLINDNVAENLEEQNRMRREAWEFDRDLMLQEKDLRDRIQTENQRHLDEQAAKVDAVASALRGLGLDTVQFNEIMEDTNLQFERAQTDLEILESALKAAGVEGGILSGILEQVTGILEEMGAQVGAINTSFGAELVDLNAGLTSQQRLSNFGYPEVVQQRSAAEAQLTQLLGQLSNDPAVGAQPNLRRDIQRLIDEMMRLTYMLNRPGGSQIPMNFNFTGNVLADDIPQIVERAWRELADQGGGQPLGAAVG